MRSIEGAALNVSVGCVPGTVEGGTRTSGSGTGIQETNDGGVCTVGGTRCCFGLECTPGSGGSTCESVIN